jgi:hypothetical protein
LQYNTVLSYGAPIILCLQELTTHIYGHGFVDGSDLSSFESCCRSGKDSSDSEAEDLEHAEKLRHVKAVLEEVIFSD